LDQGAQKARHGRERPCPSGYGQNSSSSSSYSSRSRCIGDSRNSSLKPGSSCGHLLRGRKGVAAYSRGSDAAHARRRQEGCGRHGYGYGEQRGGRLQARPRLPRPLSESGSAHSLSSLQADRAERKLSGWAPYRNSTATSPWVRKRRRYRLRLRLRRRLRLCLQKRRYHPTIQPLSKIYVDHAILLLSSIMNAAYV
jgi:hypothetical protein